jgi:hypothetical protein
VAGEYDGWSDGFSAGQSIRNMTLYAGDIENIKPAEMAAKKNKEANAATPNSRKAGPSVAEERHERVGGPAHQGVRLPRLRANPHRDRRHLIRAPEDRFRGVF